MVLLITVGSVPEKQKQKGSVGADESVREAKVVSLPWQSLLPEWAGVPDC